MTPEGLRRLLVGTTPGPWRVGLDRTEDETCAIHALVPRKGAILAVLIADEIDNRDDADLIASAPALAAMIAGMRAQYGVEVQRPNGEWLTPYSWHDSPEQARNCVTAIYGRGTANRRIVRRYVTEPEEI